jgi:hypothetical protein
VTYEIVLDTVLGIGISISIGNGNGNGISIAVRRWHQALLRHNSAAKLSVPIEKFICCIVKTNEGGAKCSSGSATWWPMPMPPKKIPDVVH